MAPAIYLFIRAKFVFASRLRCPNCGPNGLHVWSVGGLGIWGASRARGPPTGGLGAPALSTQLQPSAAWPRHLGPRQDHAGIKNIVLAMMKSGKSLKNIDTAIRETVSHSLPAVDKRGYQIVRSKKGVPNNYRSQRLDRTAKQERVARLEKVSVKRAHDQNSIEGQTPGKKPRKKETLLEALERGVKDDQGRVRSGGPRKDDQGAF